MIIFYLLIISNLSFGDNHLSTFSSILISIIGDSYMKDKIYPNIRSIMILSIFILFIISCQIDNNNQNKKVLVVHSYHIEYAWTKSIDDGIKYVLEPLGYEIESFFMDTKRNADEGFKIDSGKKAIDLVKSFKPDIIITSDDNAQTYFGKHLVQDYDIPIVYCGVNADPAIYGYTENNSTGIIERPHIRHTITLINKLVPEIESYTILTDDSATSDGFISYFNSLELNIKIDNIIQTNESNIWKDAIRSLQSDVLISYMYHTINDENGNYIEPVDVMQWTNKNFNKPSIGFFEFAVQDGILLGNVENGFEHGEMAANMVLEIIDGKKTSEIEVVPSKKGLLIVNDKTSQRLNINIDPIKIIADKVY